MCFLKGILLEWSITIQNHISFKAKIIRITRVKFCPLRIFFEAERLPSFACAKRRHWLSLREFGWANHLYLENFWMSCFFLRQPLFQFSFLLTERRVEHKNHTQSIFHECRPAPFITSTKEISERDKKSNTLYRPSSPTTRRWKCASLFQLEFRSVYFLVCLEEKEIVPSQTRESSLLWLDDKGLASPETWPENLQEKICHKTFDKKCEYFWEE